MCWFPSYVGPTYIRHDEKVMTVTREAYAAEIVQTRQERPNLRFVVYDHSFEGHRALLRLTLKFTDPKTAATGTRAGVQVYRIEGGKLPENWVMFQEPDSSLPAAVAQEHWTSPPSVKKGFAVPTEPSKRSMVPVATEKPHPVIHS